MKYKIKDWWWDGPDFIVETIDNEQIVFQNACIQNLHFGDFECDSSESCTIELTQRYSDVKFEA